MRSLYFLAFVLITAPATAEWQPDPANELQLESAAAIDRYRDVAGDSIDTLLTNSHAFAVFPRFRRTSLVAGWASGQGILVEEGRFAGSVRQRRFSIGFQLGYQSQVQILLFRDERATREFKENRIRFTPQASVHASKTRRAADTSFSPRVSVLSISEKGLSVEAAIGGSKYRFTPAENAAESADTD